MRIYCDGIFDLFHVGHLETLQYIKNMYPNVYLIIGLISDKDASSYKRPPIINEAHRKQMLENCVYVDEIITHAPLIIDKKFLENHCIDLVVHGFSDPKDSKKQEKFFETAKNLGKFEEIPYSCLDSTTKIIRRIRDR